jgi:hypothetical protein
MILNTYFLIRLRDPAFALPDEPDMSTVEGSTNPPRCRHAHSDTSIVESARDTNQIALVVILNQFDTV